MNICKLVVVLVNYNNDNDTKNCINSILLTEGLKPYIVIVDNASKNKEKLHYLEQISTDIHLIQNEDNIGFGCANNIGISWANKNLNYEYLLLLNNDTFVRPNTLSLLIDAFNKAPNIGVTTGKILYDAEKTKIWYGGGFVNKYRGWPKISDFGRTATKEGANKSKLVTFASGCLMMFTKDSINKLKGFDEEFFMYCEDLELSMRAINGGFRIWYEAEAIIYHIVNGSMGGKENKKKDNNYGNPAVHFILYNMRVNQWIAMQKNLSKLSFLLFNITFIVELFLKLYYYLFHGNFRILKTYGQITKAIFIHKKNVKK